MSRPTRVILVSLLLCVPALAKPKAASTSTPPPPVAEKPAKPAEDDANIVITLRHMNGEKEVYSREVDSMDLIFDPIGKLTQLHLTLITNGEKDTHRWYSVANLASFSYRFINVAGKGKVRLQVLQSIDADKSDTHPSLPAILPKDYR